MKKIPAFISVLLMVFLSIKPNILAQSESSSQKTIKYVAGKKITEPMIAVNPVDPDNFIAVYSNWIDSDYRRPGSSRTTNGGTTWSSTKNFS